MALLGTELGDIAGLTDDEVDTLIAERAPHTRPSARRKGVIELHNLREIREGDYVITPPRYDQGDNAPVLIGYCNGRYKWAPRCVHADYPHCVGVQWQRKLAWNALPRALRYSIRHPNRPFATVFETTDHISELEGLLVQV